MEEGVVQEEEVVDAKELVDWGAGGPSVMCRSEHSWSAPSPASPGLSFPVTVTVAGTAVVARSPATLPSLSQKGHVET